MSVRPKRNSASRFPCKGHKIHTQVLTIRITINFYGFVQGGCESKDLGPVGRQSQAIIVNAAARMTENLNRWIS